MIVLAVAMLCGAPRPVRAADGPLTCSFKGIGEKKTNLIELKTTVAIPLDNSGIARLDAVNPRRPYPLVQPDKVLRELGKDEAQDSCYKHLDQVTLTFPNRTDRYLGVQLSLNLKSGELMAELADLVQEASIEQQNARIDALERNKVASEVAGRLEAYQGLEKRLKEPLLDKIGCQEAIQQLDHFSPESADLLDRCDGNLATLPKQALQPSTQEKLGRFLDDLRRIAGTLHRLSKELPAGGKLTDLCKSDPSAHMVHCTPKLVVSPGGTQRVPGDILNLLDKGTATFTVTFENSADIPSNQTGYLQTDETPTEAPDSTKLQLSAQVGAAWDPDTGKQADKKTFNTDSPFRGDRLQHFFGAGNFKVSQRLGSRATATATLGFKKGDLGSKDTTQQVSVPEYMVDFYGMTDLQLVFGKYTLAKPSDGIAVNVVGEGFELRLPQSVSLGYVVKRESAFGEADSQNRDNSLVLAQLKNGAFPGSRFLRSGSLIALYGKEGSATQDVPSGFLPLDKDHCPQKDSNPVTMQQQVCYAYHYWTVGGEVAFFQALDKAPKDAPSKLPDKDGPPKLPNNTLSGTLALYYSERKLDRFAAERTGDRVRDGRGYTGLFKPTYLHFKDNKLRFSIGAQLGYGSGGKATDRIDRGYLGESAVFAPDQIFFGGFAGHVSDGENPTGKQALAPGLSNKSYLGLTGTTPLFSPLEWVVQLLRMEETPSSKSTTLKLNWYRFNQPAFPSHDAGSEADLEFAIEIPKGITTTIDMGYFRPGEALRSVILKDVWAISASVKATI